MKRTTDKCSTGSLSQFSRPFHGLALIIALVPTDESVGYYHSSASPTFAAKPLGGIIKGMNGVPEIVGGVEDHVHILASPEASALHCGCTSRLEEGIVHVG